MGNSISSNQVFERLLQIEDEGNVERAIELLRHVINHGINAQLGHGGTALHHACNEKRLALSRLLIELGANVGEVDFRDSTPLHQACITKDFDACLELVKLLVENNADVNAKHIHGETPLHISKDSEIIKYLIESGANVNARDDFAYTPLHMSNDFEIIK